MNPDLIIIFLLGIVNFALHRAVLRSGHRLLRQLPGGGRAGDRPWTLVAEFVVLLAAMLLAAHGWAGLVWLYAGYSILNALCAWLVLSGRI